MELREEQKVEWEKTLKELELMSADDVIEEHTRGDRWTFLGGQTRGNFFFTREKFIFVGGFGLKNFSIKYSDFKEIKKSMVGLFIPTGIKVTATDSESGKDQKYTCSVMKRKQWMELLSNKSQVALN